MTFVHFNTRFMFYIDVLFWQSCLSKSDFVQIPNVSRWMDYIQVCLLILYNFIINVSFLAQI